MYVHICASTYNHSVGPHVPPQLVISLLVIAVVLMLVLQYYCFHFNQIPCHSPPILYYFYIFSYFFFLIFIIDCIIYFVSSSMSVYYCLHCILFSWLLLSCLFTYHDFKSTSFIYLIISFIPREQNLIYQSAFSSFIGIFLSSICF